tara:strand:- start:87295 stop:87966 length:672 start_codon:yes stop_codon:yes gene_type:complete
MHRKGIKFILLGVFILLTSCFEIIEEVSFNEDGSGNVMLTLNLSQSRTKLNSFMLLDSVNKYKVPSKIEIRDHFNKIATTIKNTNGISNVQHTVNFDDYIFTISCDFKDVEALNTVISNFSSKNEAALIQQNKHFSYDQSKDVFTRNYHYDLATEFKKTQLEDRKVIESATYTTIYRFKKPIISSNNQAAKIASSKKAVMLKVNVKDIITNQKSIKNQITLQH